MSFVLDSKFFVFHYSFLPLSWRAGSRRAGIVRRRVVPGSPDGHLRAPGSNGGGDGGEEGRPHPRRSRFLEEDARNPRQGLLRRMENENRTRQGFVHQVECFIGLWFSSYPANGDVTLTLSFHPSARRSCCSTNPRITWIWKPAFGWKTI